jgi:threonine dehydrogenase-like Zn-dependent dehydrogenase
MNKNLTINMGNGNHPRYIPKLLEMVESGVVHPESVVTQREPLRDVIEAYREFDQRRPGWLKVAVDPTARAALHRPVSRLHRAALAMHSP